MSDGRERVVVEPILRRRHPTARRVDRLLTRVLALAGQVLARPSESLLMGVTGRSRGGPPASSLWEGGKALELGRRALDHGQYGEALVQFARAADMAPRDPWPWHGRGDVLQLSGDFAGALDAYDQALQRLPELPVSLLGRGNALEGLERLDEAQAAWRRALELDPELTWAAQGLARHENGEA